MNTSEIITAIAGSVGVSWGVVKMMLSRELTKYDELHKRVDTIEKSYVTREESDKKIETVHSHIRSDFNTITDLIKGLNDRIDRLFENRGTSK